MPRRAAAFERTIRLRLVVLRPTCRASHYGVCNQHLKPNALPHDAVSSGVACQHRAHHRRARADQYRQDPPRGRADAGPPRGMIGLPLRLLAREIYDRIVRLRGRRAVALITGEEKIVPPQRALFRLHRRGDAARPARSSSWPSTRSSSAPTPSAATSSPTACCTPAARTRPCSWAPAPWRRWSARLVPDAEIVTRPRFSTLTYAGPKKLTRLPPPHAPSSPSRPTDVYAIAELIRRQRGGAAVVMGALQPAHPQRPGRALPVRRGRLTWWPPTPSAWA